jgi:hypothetical protein
MLFFDLPIISPKNYKCDNFVEIITISPKTLGLNGFFIIFFLSPACSSKLNTIFIPAKINFDATSSSQASMLSQTSTTPGGYADYNISADTKVIQVAKGLVIDLRKKHPFTQVQKISTGNDEKAAQLQLAEGARIKISASISAVSTHIASLIISSFLCCSCSIETNT